MFSKSRKKTESYFFSSWYLFLLFGLIHLKISSFLQQLFENSLRQTLPRRAGIFLSFLFSGRWFVPLNILFLWRMFTLNKQTENNSIWESAFYKNEWVKIHSSWIIFTFFFMCVAVKASELFSTAHLANIKRFLYHSNVSF